MGMGCGGGCVHTYNGEREGANALKCKEKLRNEIETCRVVGSVTVLYFVFFSHLHEHCHFCLFFFLAVLAIFTLRPPISGSSLAATESIPHIPNGRTRLLLYPR